ncbi:MAG: nucleotidyltransferase family protein [Bacteroidales bacterium]|nr:nucleotidyltransferase family protein [Candidatus Physcousia equi]
MDSFSVIVLLIQAAMQNEHAELPSEVDWQEVFRLSNVQGVNGLCLEGMNRILTRKPEQHENRDELWLQRMRWMGITMKLEQTTLQHYEMLHVLVDGMCAELGIDHVVIMKGFTISRLWPNPKLRPCCDIDIYTGSNHRRVDDWLSSKGVRIEGNRNGKHTAFTLNGVHFENHRQYLGGMKAMLPINDYLDSLDPIEIMGMPGAKQLPPLGNCIFNLCHLATHFQEYESLTLRHIVDWALLLKTVQPEEYKSLVVSFDLALVNDLLTALAIQVTHANLSEYIVNGVPERDVNRAFGDIVSCKKHRTATLKDWPSNFLLIFRNHWKYHYSPNSFSERVWGSIKRKIIGSKD